MRKDQIYRFAPFPLLPTTHRLTRLHNHHHHHHHHYHHYHYHHWPGRPCTHQASTWSEGRGDRKTSALIELHHSSLRMHMHLREGSIFVEIVETDYHRMYNWTGSMCRVAETVLGLSSPLCPGQNQARVPRRLETSQSDRSFWREHGGLNDKVEHCTALSWLLCSPFICESITSLIKLEDALPESRFE